MTWRLKKNHFEKENKRNKWPLLFGEFIAFTQ